VTFERLVSKVAKSTSPLVAPYASVSKVVASTLAELGFKVNEATGEIEGTEGFVMSLEKPYEPPAQKNVRFSGARRKR
jgi:hypothetical protein